MVVWAAAGPYVWGSLPHLITLGFLYDIRLGRLPKILVLLPIVLYSSYYYFYFKESAAIAQVEQELKAQNPKVVLAYDSSKHSLVVPEPDRFVSLNKVPVVYSEAPNVPEGYISYRVVTVEMGSEVRREKFPIEQVLNVGGRARPRQGLFDLSMPSQSVCFIPQVPEHPVLKVTRKEQRPVIAELKYQKHGLEYSYGGIAETTAQFSKATYQFEFDGQRLGIFTTASIQRLPIFPFFVVFGMLNDAAPAWQVIACFHRYEKQLDTFPDKSSREKYHADPVCAMLQIDQYRDFELQHFEPFPENVAFVERLLKRKREEKPSDFNEWGVRKDSPYLPRIANKNGFPSYEGLIIAGKLGGSFYSFIQANHGKTVYIDATARACNIGVKGISLYGFANNETIRRSQNYVVQFEPADEAEYEIHRNNRSITDARIKGLWHVGETDEAKRKWLNKLVGVSNPSP